MWYFDGWDWFYQLHQIFFKSLSSFIGLSVGKKSERRLMLIFYIIMWVLWKAQNDWIFNNEAVSAGEVVDKIKEMAWHWFLASLAKSSLYFFERTCDPPQCLQFLGSDRVFSTCFKADCCCSVLGICRSMFSKSFALGCQ